MERSDGDTISFGDYNAPMIAKFFEFLVIRECILTHDVMAKRGTMCDMRCFLCDKFDYSLVGYLLLCSKSLENNECVTRLSFNVACRLNAIDM